MRRRSIKLGSYHASERLIRIHPALDQPFVPEYFIAFVIFHEMLHERIGTTRQGHGRRCVHPPEFRALEARFPSAAEALRWEKENLGKLLRYKPA
jgi:predicted metal-dependent hydrolase